LQPEYAEEKKKVNTKARRCLEAMQHFAKIKPWHRITLISEPATPMPSWFSKVIPDISTTNGNVTGGEIGDFATLINL
jgi:hypothetical protein